MLSLYLLSHSQNIGIILDSMTFGDTKWHYKYSRQLQGIMNFYPNRDFPKEDKEGKKASGENRLKEY